MDMRGSFTLSPVKGDGMKCLLQESVTPSFFHVSSKGTGP